MRATLLLAALASASVAAGAPAAEKPRTYMPGYDEPAARWETLDDARHEVCRDRVRQVRDASGQPDLDRQTASPDDALFIAAVDRRIGECSVLVMRSDFDDIRPLPKPPQGSLLVPAQ